jgi:pyruvate dehydrogenase E2 component (dihydrolipoamide acetyltransferase)
MPQLGETVTEGTVTRWLKKVGDPVVQDEALFEVSTDKVDTEVPSPASGYLVEILVPEGQTVEVGTRLAVVSPEPPGAQPKDSGGAGQQAIEHAPPAPPPPPPEVATSQPEPAPPAARIAVAVGGGVSGPEPDRETNGRRSLLSPLVRRLLSEHGIDPAEITGTGQGGRITRDDVMAYIQARSGAPAEAVRPAVQAEEKPAQVAPSETVPLEPLRQSQRLAPVSAGPEDEVVPFNNIRRLTAEHMVRSKATSAHTLVAVEVDFERVEQARRHAKEEFRRTYGVNLTYLPFMARAVVEGLRAYPHLNSSVGEDSLIVHRRIHLGIAVDLGGEGLIVPVIHDVDQMRIPAIARAVADLAERARNRRLSADDIAGGTFTITNPGPFGTFLTAPIINQPQVAILSTDGIKRRPVVVTDSSGGEAIAIHSVGLLGLSFDHRAVDGAYASRFLAKVREVIETWDWHQEL